MHTQIKATPGGLSKTLIIVDEAHNLLSQERYAKDFYEFREGLWNVGIRIVFMTATPMSNSFLDVVNLVSVLGSRKLTEQLKLHQYCEKKPTDIEASRKKMMSRFVKDNWNTVNKRWLTPQKTRNIRRLLKGRVSYFDFRGDASVFAQPEVSFEMSLKLYQVDAILSECVLPVEVIKDKLKKTDIRAILNQASVLVNYDPSTKILSSKSAVSGYTKHTNYKAKNKVGKGNEKLKTYDDNMKYCLTKAMVTNKASLDLLVKNIQENDIASRKFLMNKYYNDDTNQPRMVSYKQFVFVDTKTGKTDKEKNGNVTIQAIVDRLKREGYKQITDAISQKTTDYKSFVVITSSNFETVKPPDPEEEEILQMDKSARGLLDLFNSDQNLDGKKIAFLIGDTSLKEGIDLMAVKFVHILGIVENHGDLVQATARAVRNCSRRNTPFEEGQSWKVMVKIYTPRLGDQINSLYPQEILKLLKEDVSDADLIRDALKKLLRSTAFDKLLLDNINDKSEMVDRKLTLLKKSNNA